MATLSELFEDHLKDIYYAEKQIVKTLPKMAKKAQSPQLKQAFQTHLTETEGQVERLEKIFGLMGKPPKAKKCPAIDGIIEEGAELIEEHEVGAALDAGMAAAAQAVEHYEIARYGTLVAWATELGLTECCDLLTETLEQEERTDESLSELALAELNSAANRSNEDDEKGDDEDSDEAKTRSRSAAPAGKPAAKKAKSKAA